jgi:two-component system, NtrC family, sensor histidine kinase HydH
MKLSSPGTRWAAWGLFAATFAMGASLLLTSWSSYRSVIAASTAVTRSQGDAFLRSLFALGRREGGNVSPTDLRAFLEEQRAAGLRYVALVGAADGERIEAGVPAGGPAEASDSPARDVEIRRIGPRARLVARPPAPPGEGGGEGQPARHRTPPAVTIEFEPLVATQLAADASRALRTSAAAAAGLLLVAALFARMLLQREAAERRFEEQRRLAALGEMSSVLAHELRNPLASLKGHAQLLVERLPDGRERGKAERIVLEAQRLEALSADLLDFSRSGPIARTEADPAALLRSAAEAVDAGRVRLTVSGAPARWPLDPSRTRQVLTNLLANALEASPADAPVDARVSTRGGRLLFTVRDRGAGLPPGQEHRLFEPFFTTRAKGTGLGLAVTQRIVEMHGGTVRAANHPEGGAVFEVELPRS